MGHLWFWEASTQEAQIISIGQCFLKFTRRLAMKSFPSPKNKHVDHKQPPGFIAISHRSARSSGTMPTTGFDWMSHNLKSSHSAITRALYPFAFKQKPYSSRTSIRNLNLFWLHETRWRLRHRVKSSKALFKAVFQAAGSLEETSTAPKICICSSIPLSS